MWKGSYTICLLLYFKEVQIYWEHSFSSIIQFASEGSGKQLAAVTVCNSHQHLTLKALAAGRHKRFLLCPPGWVLTLIKTGGRRPIQSLFSLQLPDDGRDVHIYTGSAQIHFRSVRSISGKS